jgi:hypothetical protein
LTEVLEVRSQQPVGLNDGNFVAQRFYCGDLDVIGDSILTLDQGRRKKERAAREGSPLKFGFGFLTA